MGSNKIEWAQTNWLLNIGVGAAFFAVDGPFLASELSPAIPFFAALLLLLTFIALASAGFTDPGIIPRGSRFESQDGDAEAPAYVVSK